VRLVALLVGTFGLWAATARADELVLRGNYWRDRNTRVVAPEADVSRELPTGTVVGAGYLLDTITSASQAAGVLSDQPFTEVRTQFSAHLGQRLGPVTASADYRYSTESDYWAHVGSGTLALDLFQKNTQLALSYARSHADVARRTTATGYIPIGHLDGDFLILGVTQLLSPWALADLSYEFNKNGDARDGGQHQENPYRMVLVGGTPQRELEPRERDRHAVTAGLRVALPSAPRPIRHLSFYFKYRFYADNWGVVAHAPELRTYFQIGPVEVRATGRYYTQQAASFWPRDASGRALIVPSYATQGASFGAPSDPNHCLCFTGDAKLGEFSSLYYELRLGWWVPFPRLIGDVFMTVSYGHYFNTLAAHAQFGDADVAGTDLVFPF
jgi:hypothetical protein